MAKMTTKFSSTKAELNLGEMKLYEIKKESVDIVDLQEILESFDGKTINISISEDKTVSVAEDVEDEDDEDIEED